MFRLFIIGIFEKLDNLNKLNPLRYMTSDSENKTN